MKVNPLQLAIYLLVAVFFLPLSVYEWMSLKDVRFRMVFLLLPGLIGARAAIRKPKNEAELKKTLREVVEFLERGEMAYVATAEVDWIKSYLK